MPNPVVMERRIWMVVLALLFGSAGVAAASGGRKPERACAEACVDGSGSCSTVAGCQGGVAERAYGCAQPDVVRRSPPSGAAVVALCVAIAGLLLGNLWLMIVVLTLIRSGAPGGDRGAGRDRDGAGVSRARRQTAG